ncbi:MAG TPA: hypothetical protein VGM25_06510 [Caulobacteraceae bacterium]|jgi:hypothetical protein
MSQTHAMAPRPADGMDADLKPLLASLAASLESAPAVETPYRHWIPENILPDALARELAALPFEAPDLHGLSGKRELHNDTRQYFDAANNAKFSACGQLSRLFQDEATVKLLQDATGADLSNTNVRIEYAVDSDCFWLQPHTDLGVKRITILYYLPDSPDQEDLGTDIYADADTWAARAPFRWNTALVFVPSTNTYHGFERREIPRIRRSVIINYVTQDWRAREQLAYPDQPVAG